MSHQDLTAIPPQLVSGTQYTYRRSSAEFLPSDGWTLWLYIAGKSYLAKQFTAVGDEYEITLTSAEMAALAAGNYLWEERAINGTEKHRFAFDSLQVFPDLAAATAGSLESRNAKILRAIRAAIDIRMGIGGAGTDLVKSYSIGNRSFDKEPIETMLSLEARYAMAVTREASPGKFGPTVKVRFPSVSSTPWLPGR